MRDIKPNWDRMTEMGNKFIDIHKTLKLPVESVNFGITDVSGKGCGTVACHGGWGCVIFKLPYESTDRPAYVAGADAITEFIGFKDECDYPGRMKDNFCSWAARNPEIWGNDSGGVMFSTSGYRAFGFDSYVGCTLEDIGLHYLNVAARGRAGDAKNETS